MQLTPTQSLLAETYSEEKNKWESVKDSLSKELNDILEQMAILQSKENHSLVDGTFDDDMFQDFVSKEEKRLREQYNLLTKRIENHTKNKPQQYMYELAMIDNKLFHVRA